MQELLARWRKEYPRRAFGGWWALAGFSFQTAAFLLRFFRNLEQVDGREPGEFAEMEGISDVLCPEDGRFVIIQAKRTLTKPLLASTLEEAYLLTGLCLRHTPELLGRLRFQITCRERATPQTPDTLSMADVIGDDGDERCWDAMRAQFDPESPVVEEPNPIDRLHVHLWNAGIKDTTALIEQCAGRLLAGFGAGDPDTTRSAGRSLASLFFFAERRSEWEPFGRVLTQEDTSPDPRASECRSVLTGQRPTLEHLRKGYFRDRPAVFGMLWECFGEWLRGLEAPGETEIGKTPVFWIGGRSGEGKSVLLLQLVARVLRSAPGLPLVQLKSGDGLPRLMEASTSRGAVADLAYSRVFAVVDDVYDLSDRDAWDEAARNAAALGEPRLALITCGPSEQREQFAARLSDRFYVRESDAPMLDESECRAFLEWYLERTRETRNVSDLTTGNPILVQFMFELARGEKLAAFAKRFRRRLEHVHLFEAARTIAAVNALYLDAPLELLASEQSRDAMERLCEEDQLHFEITPADQHTGGEGVRLAHSHIAWLLFVEWVEPPTTLAKAWARELACALQAAEQRTAWTLGRALLRQILDTPRLSDETATAPSRSAADRREVIGELYRIHVAHHNGMPSTPMVPGWLQVVYEIPDVNLVPDPAVHAVRLLRDDATAESLHASVARWVLDISESRPEAESRQFREAAMEFLMRFPDSPAVPTALHRILSLGGERESGKGFLLDWLTANRLHPMGYWIIAPLVSRNPHDAEVKARAYQWLDDPANREHAQRYQVLIPLVRAWPRDGETRSRALDWLDDPANAEHPQRYRLLIRLVKVSPQHAETRRRALDWLDDPANAEHPQCYFFLTALVSAMPHDAAVRSRALDWLDNPANAEHPQRYHPLEALLSARPHDAAVVTRAFDWLETNAGHAQVHHVLRPLVSANPQDPEVRGRAREWVEANAEHPEVYNVLAALVRANPKDAEVMRRAANWLDANATHRGYGLLLGTMIARAAGHEAWLQRGEAYLRTPACRHPEGIIGVLLTGGNSAPKYVELALDYLGGHPAVGKRDFVLKQLSRALALNPKSALQYLNEPYDDRRKSVVCTALAHGLEGIPKAIPAFVAHVIPNVHPRYLSSLFVNIIERGVESDELDALIARWLAGKFRRRGSGDVLAALQADRRRWQRVAATGLLPQAILDDFDELSHRSRVGGALD